MYIYTKTYFINSLDWYHLHLNHLIFIRIEKSTSSVLLEMPYNSSIYEWK